MIFCLASNVANSGANYLLRWFQTNQVDRTNHCLVSVLGTIFLLHGEAVSIVQNISGATSSIEARRLQVKLDYTSKDRKLTGRLDIAVPAECKELTPCWAVTEYGTDALWNVAIALWDSATTKHYYGPRLSEGSLVEAFRACSAPCTKKRLSLQV